MTESSKEIIDKRLAVGMSIARRHLIPFLKGLVEEYKYERLEVASALLILAYNIVRKGKPAVQARRVFNALSRGAA